ncbi:putative Transmembrane protein [Diplonema papillatum]|nr:putative Transmembrane protein [Diplonema papillatum]
MGTRVQQRNNSVVLRRMASDRSPGRINSKTNFSSISGSPGLLGIDTEAEKRRAYLQYEVPTTTSKHSRPAHPPPPPPPFPPPPPPPPLAEKHRSRHLEANIMVNGLPPSGDTPSPIFNLPLSLSPPAMPAPEHTTSDDLLLERGLSNLTTQTIHTMQTGSHSASIRELKEVSEEIRHRPRANSRALSCINLNGHHRERRGSLVLLRPQHASGRDVQRSSSGLVTSRHLEQPQTPGGRDRVKGSPALSVLDLLDMPASMQQSLRLGADGFTLDHQNSPQTPGGSSPHVQFPPSPLKKKTPSISFSTDPLLHDTSCPPSPKVNSPSPAKQSKRASFFGKLSGPVGPKSDTRRESFRNMKKSGIYSSVALRARLSMIPDDDASREVAALVPVDSRLSLAQTLVTRNEGFQSDLAGSIPRTNEQVDADTLVALFEKFDRFWMSIIFLYSLYQLIMIPSRLGLDAPPSWAEIAVDLVLDVLFWLEVALRFLRPYEAGGLLVTNKWQIAQTYLKGDFWWDLLIILPLDVIGLGLYFRNGLHESPWRKESMILSPAWRMNKLLLARYSDKQFSACFKMVYASHPLVMRAIRTIWAFTLMTHYVCCGWLAVHFHEGEEVGVRFSALPEVYSGDIVLQYFLMYDYSTKAMVGMGRPGKTMPQTDLEAIYSVINAFFGVAIYATVLATIANLVADDVSEAEKWRNKMDELSDALGYVSRNRDEVLPHNFTSEVRAYYHHFFWRSRVLLGSIDDLMEDLPARLSYSVETLVGGETLSRVPMFKQASSNPAFLHYMLKRLEPVTFCKDEVIMTRGGEGHCMYFIMAGSMGIINDKTGEVIAVCESGSFLGEIAVLHNCRRTATVAALTYSSAFRLRKEAFKEAEELFPKAIATIREHARDKLQKIKLEEIVMKVPLFAACKDDPVFIQEVVGALEPKVLPPNYEVVRKGEIGSEMFFVAKGELSVRVDGMTVHTLNEGSYFGEIVMLFDTRRTASIFAETHVDLFTLSKTQFKHLMDRFPEQANQIELTGRERFRNFLVEDLLKKVNLFSGLKNEVTFLDSLAAVLKPMAIEDDDCLVTIGEALSAMFFVSTGEIAVISENDQVSHFLREGDHFGGMALIQDYASHCTLLARTQCEIYLLTRSDFQKLSDTYYAETKILKDFAVSQLKAMVFERMYTVTDTGILRAYYSRLLSYARMARFAAIQAQHRHSQTRESIKGLLKNRESGRRPSSVESSGAMVSPSLLSPGIGSAEDDHF